MRVNNLVFPEPDGPIIIILCFVEVRSISTKQTSLCLIDLHTAVIDLNNAITQKRTRSRSMHIGVITITVVLVC